MGMVNYSISVYTPTQIRSQRTDNSPVHIITYRLVLYRRKRTGKLPKNY